GARERLDRDQQLLLRRARAADDAPRPPHRSRTDRLQAAVVAPRRRHARRLHAALPAALSALTQSPGKTPKLPHTHTIAFRHVTSVRRASRAESLSRASFPGRFRLPNE